MRPHDHLVGGEAARGVAFAIGFFGAQSTRDIDPVGHLTTQAFLCAHERLKVVGLNERRRRMGDIEQPDIAEIHRVRRADKPDRIDRLLRYDRPQSA